MRYFMHMIRAAGRLTLLFLLICLLMPFARGAAAQEDAPPLFSDLSYRATDRP